MPQVLVIGYGNPLRGDDGMGWAVAAELSQRRTSPDVEVLPCQQLTPELASAMSKAETVLFVDCARAGKPGSFRCVEVQGDAGTAAFSHDLSPSSLLSLTCELFGVCPTTYLLTICGDRFDPGESLSPAVTHSLPRLTKTLSGLIQRHLAGVPDR